jgi:hypothetical protein
MDRLQEFVEEVKRRDAAPGLFRGLLHVLIGRRVTREDGTVVSQGQTWRAAAALLKKVRWPREAVAELSLDPARLPPRDRQRFWYEAIRLAQLDSDAAAQAGDRLAERLKGSGYSVGPAPGR